MTTHRSGGKATAAERQARRRERQARAGLVRVCAWVPAPVVAAIDASATAAGETRESVIVRLLGAVAATVRSTADTD